MSTASHSLNSSIAPCTWKAALTWTATTGPFLYLCVFSMHYVASWASTLQSSYAEQETSPSHIPLPLFLRNSAAFMHLILHLKHVQFLSNEAYLTVAGLHHGLSCVSVCIFYHFFFSFSAYQQARFRCPWWASCTLFLPDIAPSPPVVYLHAVTAFAG